MADMILKYTIKDTTEVNLSYMPYIVGGGLFIPTASSFSLEDKIKVELQLPNHSEILHFEAKVIWITPPNALHHVTPGVGVQFIGDHAVKIKELIEGNLNKTLDVGGYTCGILNIRD